MLLVRVGDVDKSGNLTPLIRTAQYRFECKPVKNIYVSIGLVK